MNITIYDGARSIGGNKIYLEFDGKGIFFDFGINYKKMAEFYEEFLSPRPTRGIHDLLHLKIIPYLNIYRKDLIPSDVDISSAPKLRVDAVFLSHAHLDHAGNVGLLDYRIPAIATPTTAAILKAMRDVGGKIETEATYITPRQNNDKDPRIIEAVDYRKSAFIGRDFLVAGSYSGELEEFWRDCPSSRKLEPGAIKPLEEAIDFEIKVYEVDHSIYGSAACAVETSSGWVVYTGDLRTHGMFREKTENFIKEAKRLSPEVLIIEGTRAGREEEGEKEESEELVFETCLNATLDEKGLVIADFSPRNFERLDTFAEIARKAGRELVVLAKDAYVLEAVRYCNAEDRMKELLIYKELKAVKRKPKWEKEIEEKFEEKLVDPTEIARSPERFILCFSFWDMKHLLDIKPDSGKYIYSSSEAYTEERVIDFLRLWNWLRFFNLEVEGFEIVEENGKLLPKFHKGYHASGHASGSELIRIIEEIEPEVLIPVHTENPEFFRENFPELF